MPLFDKKIDYLQVTLADADDDGRYERDEVPATFQGNVQPMSGKETESLNIGRENEGFVKIYTNVRLNVASEKTNKPGDVVIWQGQQWEILDEQVYQNGLLNHYKYIAQFLKDVA